MAIALDKKRVEGQTTIKATLIDSAVATGDGEWINIEGMNYYSTHVSGITTATVQVFGSNKATIPDNTDDEEQLGVDITADGIQEYSVPLRWIKAKVSAWTAGTIIVEFLGRIGY